MDRSNGVQQSVTTEHVPARGAPSAALAGRGAALVLVGTVLALLVASLVERRATVLEVVRPHALGADPFFDLSVGHPRALRPPIDEPEYGWLGDEVTAPPTILPAGMRRGDGGSAGFAPVDGDACDVEALRDALLASPDKAAEFARVLGWRRGEAPFRIAELRQGYLGTETPVINHGFVAGSAVPRTMLLAAGTAVLADADGTPVVRCKCGNPLQPAAVPEGEGAGGDDGDDGGEGGDDDGKDRDPLLAKGSGDGRGNLPDSVRWFLSAPPQDEVAFGGDKGPAREVRGERNPVTAVALLPVGAGGAVRDADAGGGDLNDRPPDDVDDGEPGEDDPPPPPPPPPPDSEVVIPIPAAGWLFGGALGLLLMRLRRR